MEEHFLALSENEIVNEYERVHNELKGDCERYIKFALMLRRILFIYHNKQEYTYAKIYADLWCKSYVFIWSECDKTSYDKIALIFKENGYCE